MPDFAIVSVQDAKLQTLSGRQRTYLNEYAGYIQQLAPGMAGKLHTIENEKQTTIRRRLVVAAKMLEINLVIKRSGMDIYFWREWKEEPQPRRRTTRRRRPKEETAPPEQYLKETGELAQGETEESTESGQIP